MNFSKYFSYAIALGLLVFALSSCEQKDPVTPDPPPPPAATATVTYVLDDVLDLAKLVDIKVIYTGEDKLEKQELLTSSSFSKTIKVNLPFAAILKIIFTKKPDLVLDQETYRINNSFGLSYKTSTGNSDIVMRTSSMTIPKHQAERYIDSLTTKKYETSFEITP